MWLASCSSIPRIHPDEEDWYCCRRGQWSIFFTGKAPGDVLLLLKIDEATLFRLFSAWASMQPERMEWILPITLLAIVTLGFAQTVQPWITLITWSHIFFEWSELISFWLRRQFFFGRSSVEAVRSIIR